MILILKHKPNGLVIYDAIYLGQSGDTCRESGAYKRDNALQLCSTCAEECYRTSAVHGGGRFLCSLKPSISILIQYMWYEFHDFVLRILRDLIMTLWLFDLAGWTETGSRAREAAYAVTTAYPVTAPKAKGIYIYFMDLLCT